MPRNMKSPMMSTHFLTSFYVVLGCLVIAAQARTLPESSHNKFKLVITYGRALSPPPPSPTTSPPTKEVTSISTCIDKTNYERPLNSPPPPPKPAPPIRPITSGYGRDKSPSPPPPKSSSSPVQLEFASPCVAGSQCKGVISMITDEGKPAKSPPPSPNPSTSHHHVTSDEQLENGRSPPDFYLASS